MVGSSEIAEPPEAPDLSADVPPPVEPLAPPEAPASLAAAPDVNRSAEPASSQRTEITPPPAASGDQRDESTRLFSVDDSSRPSDPDGGSPAA